MIPVYIHSRNSKSTIQHWCLNGCQGHSCMWCSCLKASSFCPDTPRGWDCSTLYTQRWAWKCSHSTWSTGFVKTSLNHKSEQGRFCSKRKHAWTLRDTQHKRPLLPEASLQYDSSPLFMASCLETKSQPPQKKIFLSVTPACLCSPSSLHPCWGPFLPALACVPQPPSFTFCPTDPHVSGTAGSSLPPSSLLTHRHFIWIHRAQTPSPGQLSTSAHWGHVA